MSTNEVEAMGCDSPALVREEDATATLELVTVVSVVNHLKGLADGVT